MNQPASVPLSPLTNFRDLAGIAVSGGAIRRDVLWRADDVARVDPAGAEDLLAQGLSLILDLRSGEELEHTGRGPLGATEVAFRHLPMTERASVPGESLAEAVREFFSDDPEAGMGGWYAKTAVLQAKTILTGFEQIVTTPGATVFHCTAGKDRTGIFAAAVLLTLGASREDVVSDYTRSNDNLDALLARIASGGGSTAAITSDAIPMALKGAPAGNMLNMLNTLDAEHGGLVQVLHDAGLDAALTEELRHRVVVPA